MRTAIVTDSNSGIFEKEGQSLGIFVIPMPVIFDGATIYYEGKDLTHEDFYRYLKAHRPVSTSQPTPKDLMAVWEEALESGYEEIVYIPMSSGLSSSCQTARVLAENYKGKVCVADNHRISVTQRFAVQDALGMARKGYSAEKIREELEKTAYDSVIYVGVETLEYLKKGGRITPAVAAMGTILNIKPLLTIQGEKLDVYARTRGTSVCRKRLIEAMRKSVDKFHEQGMEIAVGAAGSFSDREEDLKWLEMVMSVFPGEEIQYDPLTFSIGCHVGPGAFGIGISRKVIK